MGTIVIPRSILHASFYPPPPARSALLPDCDCPSLVIAPPCHGVAVQAILRADRRLPFLASSNAHAQMPPAGRCTVHLVSSHGVASYGGALEGKN